MFKRLAASVAALALVTSQALALPLMTGPWDPTNALGTINSWIQSIPLSGSQAVLGANFSTTGQTVQTALSNTVNGGALSIGQQVIMDASGSNPANANVMTITFAFGAETCAVLVTGSSALWYATATFTITGAATESHECHGQQGTTTIASVQNTGTVNTAAAVVEQIEAQAATAGVLVVNAGARIAVR